MIQSRTDLPPSIAFSKTPSFMLQDHDMHDKSDRTASNTILVEFMSLEIEERDWIRDEPLNKFEILSLPWKSGQNADCMSFTK